MNRHPFAAPMLALSYAVLTGCGGIGANATRAVPADNDAVQSTNDAVTDSRLENGGAKSKLLVYVALPYQNTIDIYNQAGRHQPVLGQITTALNTPQGMYVVPNGDLYVANGGTGTVPIFHKGQTAPYRSLTGFGSGAADVTVDAHGTVFVASGNVYVFEGGSSTPPSMLRVGGKNKFAVHLAVDSIGDLFVQTDTDADNGAHVEMFPARSKKSIALPMETASAGGLAVDIRDDLIVCDGGLDDGYQGSISTYVPSYKNSPIHYKSLFGGTTGCAASRTLDKVWATEEGNYDAAAEYTPALQLLDQIKDGLSYPMVPGAIAVDP